MSEIPDYSGESVAPSQDAILQLGRLAVKLAQLQLEEEEQETKLKAIQKERRHYEENLIPEAMTEIGLTEVTTKGGLKVQVKDVIRASFPKDPEKVKRAFAYLEETGNGGLVKHQFVVQFGKNEGEEAEAFAKLLETNEVVGEELRTIHPSTLRAFLADQLKQGKNVPLEDFGAFKQEFAKIKRG